MFTEEFSKQRDRRPGPKKPQSNGDQQRAQRAVRHARKDKINRIRERELMED